MGWTPHNQQELSNAGVTYGSGNGTSNPNPVIIYPQSNGATVSNQQGSPTTTESVKIDRYGEPGSQYAGQPITINTGNSAEGLQTLSGTLNSGFEGLFDLINKNTDKNNAWSAAQAQKQMDFQERMNQIAMEFNAGEAAKNRDWQEMMSNTAHQREIADLKAAGLNPVLSASGGNGAATGSGATAAGVSAPSGSKADADQSGNAALASIYGALINAQTQMANANLSAQTNLKMAEMQKEAAMYGAQLSSDAAKYAAGTNYAAQVYGYDTNYKNNQEQRAWNEQHPSNVWQLPTSQPVQKGAKTVLDWALNLVNGTPSAKSRSSH